MVGFIAGIIARFLSPGPNTLNDFILTTALGIAGAFVATLIGQTIGWYRLDQGTGLIGATVGALLVLFVWNRFGATRATAAVIFASLAHRHAAGFRDGDGRVSLEVIITTPSIGLGTVQELRHGITRCFKWHDD